jgi:hypothetical protein
MKMEEWPWKEFCVFFGASAIVSYDQKELLDISTSI